MRFDLLRSYIEAINVTLRQEIKEPANLTEIEEALDDLSKLDAIIQDVEAIDSSLDVQQDNAETYSGNSWIYFITTIVLLTLYTLILFILLNLRSGSKKAAREEDNEW